MVGVKNLSLLALAGSALAAPQWGHHHGEDGGVFTHTDYVYTTVMVTVTAGQEPTSSYVPPPAPTTTTTTTEAPAPAPQTTEAPAPAPTTSSSPAPSSGSYDTADWQSVISHWRSLMGMPTINFDDTLSGNALKTCQEQNPNDDSLEHHLFPGSNGQVLAGGDAGDFVTVYVGGWLCEVPNVAGLGSAICAANGASTYGNNGGGNTETGHADILNNKQYTKIGCGYANKRWACDVSF